MSCSLICQRRGMAPRHMGRGAQAGHRRKGCTNCSCQLGVLLPSLVFEECPSLFIPIPLCLQLHGNPPIPAVIVSATQDLLGTFGWGPKTNKKKVDKKPRQKKD